MSINTINNVHLSNYNTKVYGAEIFLSSMSYGPLSLPWFADYTHLIFWFFFLTSFILSIWLIQTFYFSVRSSESKFPIRETRGFSRAQTGDTLTAIIPMSWSITMLMHASTHSSNFDENTDSTSLSLTLIAYQWGWNYLFPSDSIIFDNNKIINNYSNIKLNTKINNLFNFNLITKIDKLTFNKYFYKSLIFKFNFKNYLASYKFLFKINKFKFSNNNNFVTNKNIINNVNSYIKLFKFYKLSTKNIIYNNLNTKLSKLKIESFNKNIHKLKILYIKIDAISHLKKNYGVFTKTDILINNNSIFQNNYKNTFNKNQNLWITNINLNTKLDINIFSKINKLNYLIKYNLINNQFNNNKINYNLFILNKVNFKQYLFNKKLYNFLPEAGIDLSQTFFNSKLLIETSTTRQTNSLNNNNLIFGGLTSRIRVTSGVILPSDINIHLICGSKDVIHSWAIPGLGIKIDCIPGYNCHRRLLLRWRGLFWGQCMEVCGRYHHWMPILIRVSNIDYFMLWLNSISQLSN